ncbi:hypothetical protein FZEAL_6119 [Fusarium zealandicum]|uniref:Protein kinase domain-containing protein n=1 Tax=Fusarium zealandicum TaxID=1053134 RepID=A0A8H4XJT4_9HYPO|nr:hypothetical protein FZEAL_6119 [Fusarium zealandicum]
MHSYTFTELASGGDLMSLLFRHGTVKEFDARYILRQVVHGLCYLHEKGIVHRDLKPENILLAYSPKIAYQRVMLSDFGFSAVPRRSRMTTNVGTSIYQAPEFTISGQTHTAAVDIWSLGVIALLLVSDSHGPELNRMDQEEIGEYLCQLFPSLPRKPSTNGIDFVWSCLQTNPSDRPTAQETGKHAWLCTPEKHLQFFKLLENRMMSSWEPQDKLKPMPWELPNIVKTSPPTSGSSSQYFTASIETPVRTGRSVANKESDKAHESAEKKSDGHGEKATSPLMAPPPQPTRTKSFSPSGTKQRDQQKQPHSPWHEYIGPNQTAQPEPRSKRKRVPKFKGQDTALLPLPGLDRHLRPPVNYRHRQNILWELERSRSKFLLDPLPILPSTPLEAVEVEAPASPKKRRSTYDVVSRPRGRDRPSVPSIELR